MDASDGANAALLEQLERSLPPMDLGNAERLLREAPVSQLIVGEIANSITLLAEILASVSKLDTGAFPKAGVTLASPFQGWTDIPPMTVGTYECDLPMCSRSLSF